MVYDLLHDPCKPQRPEYFAGFAGDITLARRNHAPVSSSPSSDPSGSFRFAMPVCSMAAIELGRRHSQPRHDPAALGAFDHYHVGGGASTAVHRPARNSKRQGKVGRVCARGALARTAVDQPTNTCSAGPECQASSAGALQPSRAFATSPDFRFGHARSCIAARLGNRRL